MRQIFSPLDGFRSPFGRLMGSTAPFTPAVLFGASEPGVWYDPSDVANLAWRRNLLTFTEQFDNAVWGKLGTAPTVTANNTTDPLGGNTADRIAFAASGIANRVSQSLSTASGAVSITLSIWLRGSVGGEVLQVSDGWTNSSNFTLTTSWQRFTTTMTGNAGSTAFMLFAQTGTPTVFAWGAQLELGSVATDYQKITDVNTEVIERFPSATLYQDTAGTTPVTTPGQTVALALDKSKGLVLGPELVTNGDFSSGTGWTLQGGVSISGGVASANIAAGVNLDQSLTTTINKTYQVTYTITSFTSGSIRARLTGTANISGTVRGAVGTYTELFHATATNSVFRMTDGGGGFVGTIDNISVKELPGFHATQATLASRPTYGIVPLGGRRNLLTRTEEFNDAAWTRQASNLSANFAAAPNGTTTADLLTPTATAAAHSIYGTSFSLANGVSYAASVYVKSSGVSFVSLRGQNAVSPANYPWITVNLANGNIAANGAVLSSSAVSVGDNWWRISLVWTADATISASANLVIAASDVSTAPAIANTLGNSYTANGTDGILVWGAQLETGSSATAYQRVGSAFDVTEAGVASLSYLSFDGVDDFMVTPTITPGIDKAQVFAGVRNLTASSVGVIAELSASTATNNGAFILAARESVSNYFFGSKGTVGADVRSPASYPAPITNTLTGIGDIAGDVARLRVNGTQVAETLTDQGTGNFLAYPLFIGRRAGASLPFNGNLFSLIVRFGTNLDAGTITSTETWVNSKTGAYT